MFEAVFLLFLVITATAAERYFLLTKKDAEIRRLTNLLAARNSSELEQINRLGHPLAIVKTEKQPDKIKYRTLPDNL